MNITEWDMEEAKLAWYEEGRENKTLEIASTALTIRIS